VDGNSEQQHCGGFGESGEKRDDGCQTRGDNQGGANSIQWPKHTTDSIPASRQAVPELSRVKRVPGLLVALILIAGCVGVTVEPISSVVPSMTTTVPNVEPPTTAPGTTTSTVPPGPPVAWIAPSGVPVAVTGVNGDVIEILTPCGNPAMLTEGTPIYEVDVVVDPGHGGPVDTGAVGRTGLAEKDINLQVSLAVRDFLAERGISALLTRMADYPITIRTRSEYSDLVGARALVSIHHNAPAAPASDMPGVEIFVQDDTSESARLGGLIYDDTMGTLGQFDVDWDRAPDAGVMTVLNGDGIDAYGMVRLPDAPSALVELGYIANPAEADLYGDPAYVPAVAESVARAIEKFLTTSEAGSPLVDGRNFNPAGGVGRDQCIEPHLDEPLYPDVIEASVTGGRLAYNFVVTVSSPYETPERYADAWRIVGDDGVVYGMLELANDHAREQPFTRALAGVEIPATVRSVTIHAHDLVYGWGGQTVKLTLP
jgi:N-acetylmuramoyl-L-alanine amidase